MPPIPKIVSTLNSIIFRSHKDVRRPYLGMSEAGYECTRYLWYCLRWAFETEISDTTRRLFERGTLEEERIIRTLNEIDINIIDCQKEVVTLHGYVEGHIDGIALGVHEAPKTPHLLECKTHNDRSFKELIGYGVCEKKMTHFTQMQLYMHELGLKWALYYAVNKNTDEIYIERVPYDKDFCELAHERLLTIIEAQEPPKRIGDMDYYLCRMCDAKGICHFEVPVNKNCRTCGLVDMHEGNVWKCTNYERARFYDAELSIEQQRTGCKQHKALTN